MKILIDKQNEEVIAGGELEFRFQPDCTEVVEPDTGKVSFRLFYVKPENAVVEEVDALPDGFEIQERRLVVNPALLEELPGKLPRDGEVSLKPASPERFVPRKFLYQDGEFVPNPAFQEPE